MRSLSLFFTAFSLFFFSLANAKEPMNIAVLRQTVKQYYHSGDYMRDAKDVTNQARDYINLQVNQVINKKKKLAIVLDIDETSLSNYKKLEARGFLGDRETIHEEIMKGGSPAIPAVLDLYQEARILGVAVFFVTGRTESERLATIKNLRKAGYNKWAGIYMRPNQYKKKSIVPFKSEIRREITALGYTIIASIGDQNSDITGGYALKGFKLPNPYYYVP